MKSASVLRKLGDRFPLGFDGNRRMQRNLPPLGRAVSQRKHVANFRELQRRSLNARLVNQRRGIEQAVEVEASAGLRRYPRSSSARCCWRSIHCAVARWRERGDAPLAQRGSGIDRQQFAQVVELENAIAAVLDGIGNAHRKTNLSYRSPTGAQ